MDEAEQRWVEQAQYDLDTAKAMLESERFLYVLFCCQQAVEKALKALVVKRTSDFPPRVHNLIHLAETAGVELQEGQSEFLGDLTAFYVRSRYPEQIKKLGPTITSDFANQTLKKTETMIQWLLSLLK